MALVLSGGMLFLARSRAAGHVRKCFSVPVHEERLSLAWEKRAINQAPCKLSKHAGA
jgi:hypothetical protein